MQAYTVTQKLLSLGAVYEVREEGNNEVIMTAKGKVIAITPSITLMEGTEGAVIATLKGNFLKTTFTAFDANNNQIAVIKFPLIPILMNFSLIIGETVYKVKKALLSLTFSDAQKDSPANIEVSKKAGFKDKFNVVANDSIAKEVAILTAVTVDQKFFEGK